MQDIFNHTSSYNYNWDKHIQKYEHDRKNLSWGVNVPPERITNKMVKQNDQAYNPILQKYNDKEYEKSIKKQENANLISAIIKNQDNQLKIEQTFNIINLQDRLKGFEKHPNYPKPKDLINKRSKISHDNKKYNILSNLPLDQHHYDKPENRPKCDNTEPKKKQYDNKLTQARNYDIISTKYKNYDKEKTYIDKEIQKIRTAKIFYKNNDYNPIKGVYFNEEKEKKYQEKIKEEQKTWGVEHFKNLPRCAKGRSDVYDLITLKVVDPKEMSKIIQDEKDKKQRYEIKYKMENYYREKSLLNQDKEEQKINNKNNYLRYKEEDKRQYDIIDLGYKPFKEHAKISMKGDDSDGWQKLINCAGKNSTFQSKKIYKDQYDYSDAGFYYDNYKVNRENILKSLPKIEKDKLFNQKKQFIKSMSCQNMVGKNIVKKTFGCNKNKFFKEPPKQLNFSDKHLKIYENKELNGTKKQFEFNKEKNMRNLRKNLDFETNLETK